MSNHHDYLQRLRELVEEVAPWLTESQSVLVERLVEAGEGGEAMLALAWILVEDGRRVPSAAIQQMRELADGLIDPTDLPERLDECGF